MRLGLSENYNSSSGGSSSFDLNEDIEQEPPGTHSRHRRSIGQQRAMRTARGDGPSAPVPAPSYGPPPSDEQAATLMREKHFMDALERNATQTDPLVKSMYQALIRKWTAEQGSEGVVGGSGGAAGGFGDGNGDGDDEDEE